MLWARASIISRGDEASCKRLDELDDALERLWGEGGGGGRDLLVPADRLVQPRSIPENKYFHISEGEGIAVARDGGDFSGHLISTYFRRFPGIVLPEPRRRRVVRVFIRMHVRMRERVVCVCVCVCGCARISLFQAAESLRRHPAAPLALALPSQPSTSPRLVSNDFPPSYPDSGTHPWGTASPLFRIPPPTSLHRRHPYSGKLALLRARREPRWTKRKLDRDGWMTRIPASRRASASRVSKSEYFARRERLMRPFKFMPFRQRCHPREPDS